MAEAVAPWQLMTRGLAQAGNRASKAGHYLQWKESGPEWSAIVLCSGNAHCHGRFFFFFPATPPSTERVASGPLRLRVSGALTLNLHTPQQRKLKARFCLRVFACEEGSTCAQLCLETTRGTVEAFAGA